MTDAIRGKLSISAVASAFLLGACSSAPSSVPVEDSPSTVNQSPVAEKPPIAELPPAPDRLPFPDEPVQIHIDAPDNYIRGGVFEFRAKYEVDGELFQINVDDRLLESEASFTVELPEREHSVLNEVQVELRHPKYKPVIAVIDGGPDTVSKTITLRPMRWTTDERNSWIKPTHETSLAALEHLRWIHTAYFQRPERLLTNEAFQKDRRLVALMAYAGGSKKGGWEEVRIATIAEWEAIAKIMDERSHEPCPAGYVLETLTDRPCGALVSNAIFPDPNAGAQRAAAQAERTRQIVFARADLAKRLQLEEKDVRYGGYEHRMYDSTAIGCPAEGKTYNSEETRGYMMVFTVRYRGTYYYHGKANERPFYCAQKTELL